MAITIITRSITKNYKIRQYIESIRDTLNNQGYIAVISYIVNLDLSWNTDTYGIKVFFDIADEGNYNKWISPTLDKLEVYDFPERKQMLAEIKEGITERKKAYTKARRKLYRLSYDEIKSIIQPYFVKHRVFDNFIENRPGCPHSEYQDELTIAYCVKIDGLYLTITNYLMKKLGLDESTLYSDAIKNIKPVMKDYDNTLDGLKTCSIREDIKDISSVKILTNGNNGKGANVLLLPEFLENVAECVNDDYYISIVNDNYLFILPFRSMPPSISSPVLLDLDNRPDDICEIDDSYTCYSKFGCDVYKYIKGSFKVESAFDRSKYELKI